MDSEGREADLLEKTPAAPRRHFACHFPDCNASYARKEHLNRHEAKHSQQQTFPCSKCGRSFGRSDTLRRHIRQRHKIIEPSNRAPRACERCHAGKTRCEGGVPCDECLRRDISCSLSRPVSTAERRNRRGLPGRTPSSGENQAEMNYSDQETDWIDLYFKDFHPYWSFVHRGSFNRNNETPLLIQSMTVIGLWASGRRPAQSSAVELHKKLDQAIRDQKEKWNAAEAEGASSACVWPIPTYQAILLHIIFSAILKSRDGCHFDFKVTLDPADFELLEALVRSCRTLGMFYYSNIVAKFREVDVAEFVWICVEEIKRFNIALYKVCRKVSRPSGRRGSEGDREDGDPASLLKASELQFPLPKNRSLWYAVAKNEWLDILENEGLVISDDTSQEKWISNFAEVIDVLDL